MNWLISNLNDKSSFFNTIHEPQHVPDGGGGGGGGSGGGGGLGSNCALMCVSKSEGHGSFFSFKGVKGVRLFHPKWV